ncbi:hypothetical protein JOM56_012529 [Amanita muscaria]
MPEMKTCTQIAASDAPLFLWRKHDNRLMGNGPHGQARSPRSIRALGAKSPPASFRRTPRVAIAEIDQAEGSGSTSGGGAAAQPTPQPSAHGSPTPGIFPHPSRVFSRYGGGHGERMELKLVFVEEVTRRSSQKEQSENQLATYMRLERDHNHQFWKGIAMRVRLFFFEWNAFVLFAEMQGDACFGWKVTKMTWETFKKALLTAEGPAWRLCLEADCIVGGADFTVDFMDKQHYRFKGKEIEAYLMSLKRLEERSVVWPSPMEMLHAGAKVPLLHDLAGIAEQMGMPYPSIQIIEELPGTFSNALFLKRGYSDCTKHALRVQTREDGKKFTKMWKETEVLYGELPNLLRPKWFSMPFMESLQKMGEMRCYMVCGVFSHAIETKPDARGETLSLNTMDNVTSLEAHGQVCPTFERRSLGNSPMTLWQDGMGELKEFVCRVHDSLVAKEEERSQRPSGLRILARYDVSVFKHAGGFHHWVSEVERTHTMGLFMSTSQAFVDRLLGTLCQTLAAAVLLKRQGDEAMIRRGHETYDADETRGLLGRR